MPLRRCVKAVQCRTRLDVINRALAGRARWAQRGSSLAVAEMGELQRMRADVLEAMLRAGQQP